MRLRPPWGEEWGLIRVSLRSAEVWEYKVVQMVLHAPADPANASRKLGGALSADSLRSQFPDHYGNVEGRKQINDFLNLIGDEGWELVQFQQVGELPLMVFKRPKKSTPKPAIISST
jgi:hypothetical protein